ncbi:hypothetical protein MLD38_039521 [Melastoma candidum]|uniref:Uncharacterized protein n=1 Tax=Melastoma candidum TaxID=119954 RepID=A0ACB9L3Q9_9MYRT|nr:hypothetical protein MLD38_039521 [Melastoma candidum]
MSYLAQQLLDLDLNSHRLPEFHFPDHHETLPVSPAASSAAALPINSSSLKRRLPVPLPVSVSLSKGEDSYGDKDYQEPVAKRISLREEENSDRMGLQEREDIPYALPGFNKISLPDVSTTSTPHYPPPRQGLRRTVSDSQTIARGYFFNPESSGHDQGSRDSPRLVSQESFAFGKNKGVTQPQTTAEKGVSCGFMRPGSSLPPLPPPLRRTLSEPTPLPNELFPKSNVDSDGAAAEQSPNTKRIEKMKLRMREMGEWWAQVLREAEELDKGEDHQDRLNQECPRTHDPLVQGGTTDEEQDATEKETEKETQEAISVEILGGCLSIKFSCPCNKAYQILLAGNNCYYKLV